MVSIIVESMGWYSLYFPDESTITSQAIKSQLRQILTQNTTSKSHSSHSQNESYTDSDKLCPAREFCDSYIETGNRDSSDCDDEVSCDDEDCIEYDYDGLSISMNGMILGDGVILSSIASDSDTTGSDHSLQLPILRAHFPMIYGGKGGFGAMLRAKAKEKSSKPTVDFGACRDLNGRRLRHVNNEILLQKAQEAKEKGKKLQVDEDTPSGINMWYLATVRTLLSCHICTDCDCSLILQPSWSEGIKKSSQQKFRLRKVKTSICGDWKRAREQNPPPPDASIHWGCPRGPKCTFAHGIEELQGEAAVDAKKKEKDSKISENHKKKDEYVASAIMADEYKEEELRSMMENGLQKSKTLSSSTSSSNRDTINPINILSVSSGGSTGTMSQNASDEVEELPMDDYGF